MNTDKINSLTNLSDKYYKAKKSSDVCLSYLEKYGKYIKVDCAYCSVEIKMEDYPELKPIVKMLLEYVRDSEPVKQELIRKELLKILEK